MQDLFVLSATQVLLERLVVESRSSLYRRAGTNRPSVFACIDL